MPEPCDVCVDCEQVQRALCNLLRNAVEAGAKQLTVRVEREGGTLRFVIDDDGAGFSAEEAERASEASDATLISPNTFDICPNSRRRLGFFSAATRAWPVRI